MRLTSRLPLLASLVLPFTSLAQARPFPSDSAVLAMLRQRVEEKRAAGIVVGLVEPGGKTRVLSFGDAGPGRPALDGNSVFEIGSITKVFTATVLATLVGDGTVTLDTPVQALLPSSVRVPMRGEKAITLGNLSSQNSGLPRMPGNFAPKDAGNPYADYTVGQMYDFLSSYTLPRDPGAQLEYSNLGVGLLGHALALRTGQSYETMVRTRVLQPLGMSHTAITLTPWMRDHLALGHDDAGRVVPNWDLPTLAGAGALRSTMNDMLRFASAYVRPDATALGRAMTLAQTPRAPAGASNASIGLNWFTLRAGGDTIVWHNGGTGGYRTFIGFEPSRGTAVVVLTNSGGDGSDDLGMHLLDAALPLTPKKVQRTSIEIPVSTLAQYVGRYSLASTFAIDVALTNGVLTAQATNQQPMRMWPSAPNEFFLKDVDAQISFTRDAQGVVTGLTLHQNGRDSAGKKEP